MMGKPRKVAAVSLSGRHVGTFDSISKAARVLASAGRGKEKHNAIQIGKCLRRAIATTQGLQWFDFDDFFQMHLSGTVPVVERAHRDQRCRLLPGHKLNLGKKYNLSEEVRQQYRERLQALKNRGFCVGRGRPHVAVVEASTGRVFESIKAAALAVGCPRNTMSWLISTAHRYSKTGSKYFRKETWDRAVARTSHNEAPPQKPAEGGSGWNPVF